MFSKIHNTEKGVLDHKHSILQKGMLITTFGSWFHASQRQLWCHLKAKSKRSKFSAPWRENQISWG
ncbi:hypothetical protein TYRP_022437 [Tyrophagus putrescentiae]|nr:hypothetical protein TYRP_022437 [Tyrophagus putrescentiae]